ncbi:MAG: ABC transporter ATP-binding protein [Planctomycetota bacterium]
MSARYAFLSDRAGALVDPGASGGDTRAVLTLQGVTKSFGTLCAVEGLSLRAERGRVLGLLGPNGAGKSTTLAMVTGRLKPDAGSIHIGEDEDRSPPSSGAARRRMGIAPQEIALYDELSAEENLRLFARLYGLRGADARSAATRGLERVGLHSRARDRVGRFSGGMKRRLNLAAAVVHGPALVLLDEPTAGVDPQSRLAIFDLVRALRDEGCAVVYTTHYLEEAEKLCDTVAIVDRGRVLAEGAVADLVAQHGGSPRVLIERASGEEERRTDEPMAAVAEALRDPETREVRVERADLETVFMGLTGRSLRD